MTFRLLVAAALCLASVARAQDYPDKAVHMLVPFGAGNQVDGTARALADAMAGLLKQPVVVVNRDGAGGAIMATQLAAARPDGYTIGFGPQGQVTVLPHQRKAISYTHDSFDYVCQVFEGSLVFAVRQDSPFKSARDLIDQAKRDPDKFTWGDGGVGIVPNLLWRDVLHETGAKMRHVPYRVVGEMYKDLIAGTIDGVSSAAGSVRPGVGRVLLVYGAKRDPNHPDAPTTTELGLRANDSGFGGVYAPKGLPPAVKARLGAACQAAVETAAYREAARRLSSAVSFADGDAYAARVRADWQNKKALLDRLDIKPE